MSVVLAKAALEHKAIQTKLNIGCDGIEIQLLGELLEKDANGEWKDLSDVFCLEEFKDYPIRVVHSPLIPKKDSVLIEYILNPDNHKLFKNIFSIADYFGKVQNVKIGIVFHAETFKSYLEEIGAWNNLVSGIHEMLETFQNVYLLIENVIPARNFDNVAEVHLTNNCLFDNVEMIKALREELGTDRIYTVLDTCHQMMTEMYISSLFNAFGDFEESDLCMETFIRRNAPYLGLMHVCNMAGNGLSRGIMELPSLRKLMMY